MERSKVEEKLKENLKPSRYTHTLGVAYTAACLAMRYGEDMERAYMAGLLHDCAKCFNLEETHELCHRYGISLDGILGRSPQLIHQELGPYIARDWYEMDDAGILSAIRYHTTGTPNMSLLEQIIFVADYMEPNRRMIPGLPEIRKLAFVDLNQCTTKVLANTISYLETEGGEICQDTIDTYNYYKEKETL